MQHGSQWGSFARAAWTRILSGLGQADELWRGGKLGMASLTYEPLVIVGNGPGK